MVDTPEKIRVAQDSDGFWTCREAISGSQEYTRSDLVTKLAAENERLARLNKGLNDEVQFMRKAAKENRESASTGAVKVSELLDEGLEILNGIIDNVKRRGNYSPESTCVFIDQAGQCLREALSALESAAPEGQQEPVAYDAGIVAALLDASMKQDEIAVGSIKRAARVRELVHWFARLAQDEANPKWTRSHGSELAYYIATTSTRPSERAVTEDWQPIETAPHGVQVLLYTPPFSCMGADAKHEMRVGCASWGEVTGGISNRSFDGHATYWRPLPNPPSTLKAAMEAGGDDGHST